MANSIVEIPFDVVEANDYLTALSALVQIAMAFEAGGWNFMQACQEASNEAHYQLGESL